MATANALKRHRNKSEYCKLKAQTENNRDEGYGVHGRDVCRGGGGRGGVRVPCTSAETNSSDYERVMRDDEQNAAAKSNVAFVKPRAKPSRTKPREDEVSFAPSVVSSFLSFFFSFFAEFAEAHR